MRRLKIIRIFLATMFFVASVAYLVLGPGVQPMAAVAPRSQIIPSAIAYSAGAILVWLILTYIFGRIYCATVCPVGTITDYVVKLRKRIPALDRPYSYKPRKRWTIHVLIIYLICLIAGVVAVPYLIEPWNMMRNMASPLRHEAVETTWISLGLGIGTAVTAGIVTLLILTAYALLRGRDFCSDICPIGTALGLLHEHNLYHIEIDPDKCSSCGKCEDSCPASCIKVVSRYVDNSRCIRCFECLAPCEDDAIRYQPNRNRRPATPLLRKNIRSQG